MKIKAIVIAVSATLAGFSGAHAGTIEFSGVKTPTSDFEKRVILSSQFANVDGKQVGIGFNTIMRSGDKIGHGRNAGKGIDSEKSIDRVGDNILTQIPRVYEQEEEEGTKYPLGDDADPPHRQSLPRFIITIPFLP